MLAYLLELDQLPCAVHHQLVSVLLYGRMPEILSVAAYHA